MTTPPRPKIGVLLPQAGWSATPGNLISFARRAESLGYASVWVGDHICLPASQKSRYPYGSERADYEVPSDRPFLESLATLAFVSAVTHRIRLGISVAILPYRHPLLWLKSFGTIQALSSGRLIVGVGVGWLQKEFEVLGANFHERGATADHSLELIIEGWAGSPIQVPAGDHASISMYSVPPRADDPVPPIWIGGNGEPSLKRTARFGDVWHPHVRGCPPSAIRDGLERLADYVESSDRPSVRPTAAVHMPVRISDAATPEPWDIGAVIGPPEFIRSQLEDYANSGVTHFVLTFGGAPESRLATLTALSNVLHDWLSDPPRARPG